jgi:hypothetical protein
MYNAGRVGLSVCQDKAASDVNDNAQAALDHHLKLRVTTTDLSRFFVNFEGVSRCVTVCEVVFGLENQLSSFGRSFGPFFVL